MPYRPQWAYRKREGYRYEAWAQPVRAVDSGSLAANQTRFNFVIPFDQDADFLILGLAIDAGKNARAIGFQFTDAFNRRLSDDFIGSNLSFNPLGQNPDRGGGYIVTFNPPHFARAGSNWLWSAINFDNVVTSIPDMELRGYKCYPAGCET